MASWQTYSWARMYMEFADKKKNMYENYKYVGTDTERSVDVYSDHLSSIVMFIPTVLLKSGRNPLRQGLCWVIGAFEQVVEWFE